MVVRPICEPVELLPGASVLAEHVTIAPASPEIGRFMHFHDVAELVLFRRVKGEFIAGGRRHRLEDGAVVFVPSMRHHDFALERGAMDWVLVQIDPYIIEGIVLRARVPLLTQPFCAAPDEKARQRIDLLADWLLDSAAGQVEAPAVERIVELLLLLAADSPAGQLSAENDTPNQIERLLPALERLRTAPAEPFTLQSAATLCRVSPAYFSRRFRQLFAMTFTAYSRIYRLHLATRRLVDTGLSISEIAYGVGFSSPAHFTARFRERFGITPRAYRRNARRRVGEGK